MNYYGERAQLLLSPTHITAGQVIAVKEVATSQPGGFDGRRLAAGQHNGDYACQKSDERRDIKRFPSTRTPSNERWSELANAVVPGFACSCRVIKTNPDPVWFRVG